MKIKKKYIYKLVSTHKQYLLVFLFVLSFQTSWSQVWTMEQCIDTAKRNNKNLQISRNNVLIGIHKNNEAKANLIPKIQATSDYRYFTNLPYQLMPLSVFGGPEGQFKEAKFGVPHNITANLQFTMPLYNPILLGAVQTTDIGKEISELQFERTEEALTFEISNLYYNAQILIHQLGFIDTNLLNAQKLLKNMQLLKENLMATGTDVSKVRLQTEQLKTSAANTSSKLQQVMNALKFAMGISIDQNIQIEPEISYHDDIQYSQSSTIDIRITQTQNRFLLSELSTLKKSRFPVLSLFGTYGTTGYGYDKKPNDFLKFFPVGFAGIQISYPLFTGTVTQKKINQKKLDLQNNELQLGLIIGQNSMQVENAHLQRVDNRTAVETTLQQITLAQTIYNQTILQQKQGIASLTDVLTSDNALRQSQQSHLSAVIDYLKADLELKKLTGNFLPNNK